MPRRGSYPKGIAKRQEILERALEVIAAHGYTGATVRELADAVGLTQNGLLHYFGTKEQLFVDVLRERDRVDADRFSAGVRHRHQDVGERFAPVIRHSVEVPGLVQLYVGLAAEATSVQHPAHSYFQQRFTLLRQVYADAIREWQRVGDLPSDIEPDSLASAWIAIADGLQSQWLRDPTIDMVEQFRYLWSVLASTSTAGATDG